MQDPLSSQQTSIHSGSVCIMAHSISFFYLSVQYISALFIISLLLKIFLFGNLLLADNIQSDNSMQILEFGWKKGTDFIILLGLGKNALTMFCVGEECVIIKPIM